MLWRNFVARIWDKVYFSRKCPWIPEFLYNQLDVPNRFDITRTCDRQTDTQTRVTANYTAQRPARLKRFVCLVFACLSVTILIITGLTSVRVPLSRQKLQQIYCGLVRYRGTPVAA